jgi:hypothetical protein
MSFIKFGFGTTFEHKGSLEEVQNRKCSNNKAHQIVSGNFCPICGAEVEVNTKKERMFVDYEIEELIDGIWNQLDEKFQDIFAYYIVSTNEHSEVCLVVEKFVDPSAGYWFSADDDTNVFGHDFNEFQQATNLVAECFSVISQLIDRKYGEIHITAKITKSGD